MKIIKFMKSKCRTLTNKTFYATEEIKYEYNQASVCCGTMQGKIVVVVGASSGIGLAIVKQLIKEKSKVIMISRNCQKLEAAYSKIDSNNVFRICWDCTNIKELDDIYTKIIGMSNGKDIDAWINCHGIFSEWDAKRAFKNVPIKDLEREIYINYETTYQISKYIGKKMSRQCDGGSVLSISSICGYMRSACYTPYGLSKAGIMAMTVDLAKEFADQGVRFHCVAPGAVATSFWDENGEDGNIYADFNILKRYALPEEIAAIVVALISPMGKTLNGKIIIPSSCEKY